MTDPGTASDGALGGSTADRTSDGAWLVLVDAQAIFADPTSEWAAPRFAETMPHVRRLVEAFGERTVATRWVTPEDKVGSWGPYFDRWAFADVPADDPVLDLVPEVAALPIGHVLSEPTFGKWHDQLRELTGPTPTLVLAGVATDCCVLATALPAADSGATVVVAADACAGSDDANHQRALDAMALFDPQIVIRSTEEILADPALRGP